jgi:LmbE family N-acetylglucosaminyl deacetylase
MSTSQRSRQVLVQRRQVADLGTVLGVWAHPDDEAYLSAGLMARATANGQAVAVVHATAGEAGSSGTSLDLSSRRREEARRALAAVGVTDHTMLGHADGGCAAVPVPDAAAQLGRIIEEVAPDTIVTFGPDGITGHPDHRAVSAWVSAAVSRSRRTISVLHATTTSTFVDRYAFINEQVGLFDYDPSLPRRTEQHELALELVLGEHELDRKLVALRAHASQTKDLEARIGTARYRRWFSVEAFVEVRPLEGTDLLD